MKQYQVEHFNGIMANTLVSYIKVINRISVLL
jgi:hypothetical protein